MNDNTTVAGQRTPRKQTQFDVFERLPMKTEPPVLIVRSRQRAPESVRAFTLSTTSTVLLPDRLRMEIATAGGNP